LLESNEITMTRLLFADWRQLLDNDDRTIGWARNGHVRDGDDLLVVRGFFRGRLYSVVTRDGSLVGTMARIRSDAGRRAWGLRLGDSDQVVAEYIDRTVCLAGAEGRAVASIERFRRLLRAADWQLTFSSCEDRRLRLMALWLLARLAPSGGGG